MIILEIIDKCINNDLIFLLKDLEYLSQPFARYYYLHLVKNRFNFKWLSTHAHIVPHLCTCVVALSSSEKNLKCLWQGKINKIILMNQTSVFTSIVKIIACYYKYQHMPWLQFSAWGNINCLHLSWEVQAQLICFWINLTEYHLISNTDYFNGYEIFASSK